MSGGDSKTRAVPSSPPEAWEPLLRFARLAGLPLERFLRIEAASGILLLVAAAVALAWANSPWAETYVHLWHTPLGIRVGGFTFERSLAWVVNDGLMVIFFFVVGMEIRREIHHGELSEWKRAALPAAAALGGMLAPAALYLVIAGAPATAPGGACRWRRTSPSRSASSRCSASACPRLSECRPSSSGTRSEDSSSWASSG